MSTKEDILEQLVGEYLLHKGYFIRNNIKFVPRKDHPEFVSNKDSNHSDIDILAYHPKIQGPRKVLAVSCKSWQIGFNVSSKLDGIRNNKIANGRDAWKSFRELTVPKWSEAFVKAVEENTGLSKFTYVLAVTRVVGDPAIWQEHQPFRDALNGNPIEILTFSKMFSEVVQELNRENKKTLAATDIGRMAQLIAASGYKPI